MKDTGVYIPDEDLGSTVRAKVIKLRGVDREIDERKSGKVSAADLFARQCRIHLLPPFAREYPFANELVKRKWRFDFAFALKKPDGRQYRLGIEIEGIVMRRTHDGSWQMGGRHATIGGYKEDCIKYNTAILLGWDVLRFEQSQVKSEHAISFTKRVLMRHGWRPKS